MGKKRYIFESEPCDAETLTEILDKKNTILTTEPNSENKSALLLFEDPSEILIAYCKDDIRSILSKLDKALNSGSFAAGFISSEASKAFEASFETKDTEGFPLIYMAIFKNPPKKIILPDFKAKSLEGKCRAATKKSDYARQFENIMQNIAAGEIYQANLTFKAHFESNLSAEELFLHLYKSHPVAYPAYVNLGKVKILSLSPELFLDCDSSRIRTIPMKGTARRHPDKASDLKIARQLALDTKNRAENLMITDMARNDLSRICAPGSVIVEDLFRVDTYQTLHQMVSVVSGKLRKNLGTFDILKATFPPASISGAPKISAVNILQRNESSPRKIYTGCIGCFFPDGHFRLNVAIRTILFEGNIGQIGIGGGITSESKLDDEWSEAMLKSTFASFALPDFDIFETLLWKRESGFTFRDEHIDRILKSCKYFGRKCGCEKIEAEFDALQKTLEHTDLACAKISVTPDGSVRSTISPPRLPFWDGLSLSVAISSERTNSADTFLYHKTTNRKFYDFKLNLARQKNCHEILFFNEKGELTEGSISNVFLLKNGKWRTPKIACGLLPGVWRKRAISELKAKETILHLDDLLSADEVLLGNSLRSCAKVGKILLNGKFIELRNRRIHANRD